MSLIVDIRVTTHYRYTLSILLQVHGVRFQIIFSLSFLLVNRSITHFISYKYLFMNERKDKVKKIEEE